jgi:hypothetical protein
MSLESSSQTRSFTPRELVEELFDSDAPKAATRPFSEYVRGTPAAPLSGLTKVLLWVIGLLVAGLLVVALTRLAHHHPARNSGESRSSATVPARIPVASM